jgi:hypothetical protein
LYKTIPRDEEAMLEQEGVMVGDKIDLEGSFIDKKVEVRKPKKVAASEAPEGERRSTASVPATGSVSANSSSVAVKPAEAAVNPGSTTGAPSVSAKTPASETEPVTAVEGADKATEAASGDEARARAAASTTQPRPAEKIIKAAAPATTTAEKPQAALVAPNSSGPKSESSSQ